MRRNVKILVVFLLLVVIVCPTALTACNAKGKYVRFTFQSQTRDYESYAYYTDEWFGHSATEYDPSLATASLTFAMACFGAAEESKRSYDNAEAFLKETGYTGIRVNEHFKIVGLADTMGVIIGRKQFGEYTLIALGLRGANYGSEWASNFTLGYEIESPYHRGFYEGANIALGFLAHYLAEEGVSGKIKIWTSGYSRSAAVCNIACGRLNEALLYGYRLLPSSVELTKEDVYAYCFETPQGVPIARDPAPKSALYDNIFCVTNHDDVIPKAVMRELGFTRYGVEITLPDRRTDPNFAENVKKVEEQYGKLRSTMLFGSYDLKSFTMKRVEIDDKTIALVDDDRYVNWTQGLYFDEFVSTVTTVGIGTREAYARDFQDGLRALFRIIYNDAPTLTSGADILLALVRQLIDLDEAGVLMDDLIHAPSRIAADVTLLLSRALDGVGAQYSEAIKRFVAAIAEAFAKTAQAEPGLLLSLLSVENLTSVGRAHFPEVSLAYLRAMDKHYTSDPVAAPVDGRYYKVEISGTAENILFMREETIVAAVESGVVLDVGSSASYGYHHGRYVFYLPIGDYRFYADVYVNVQRYDPTTGGYVSVPVTLMDGVGTI